MASCYWFPKVNHQSSKKAREGKTSYGKSQLQQKWDLVEQKRLGRVASSASQVPTALNLESIYQFLMHGDNPSRWYDFSSFSISILRRSFNEGHKKNHSSMKVTRNSPLGLGIREN
jgi:hypothetical protein